MKTSFINKIINSQPILIRFALKLFVGKCLSFQLHLHLDLRFPLNKHLQLQSGTICQKNLNFQPNLVRFALKLFVGKYLSFQTHLFLDLRFL